LRAAFFGPPVGTGGSGARLITLEEQCMGRTDRYLFTSESVTEGHPDKLADQISDAVLDRILESDPNGRVACETMVTTGLCLVAGEITTHAYADIPSVARRTIKEIGYTDPSYGFDFDTCAVLSTIDEQSGDISRDR
jgi:S-adenosylmethionine synthetase